MFVESPDRVGRLTLVALALQGAARSLALAGPEAFRAAQSAKASFESRAEIETLTL
jgi:hypothetical protein